LHSTNWDDMRYVLAVVEAGSVSGAARLLGVNHATVLRRITAFEMRHGSEIFARTAQGYSVRPDRLRVIEAAREVSHAVTSVERLMSGMDAPLTGDVRVTSTDSICQMLLPEILAEFRKTAKGVRVSLVCANNHLNLARLEAQVTVRPAQRLDEGLAGDVGAHMGFAVYAANGGRDGWLGLGGSLALSKPAGWLEGVADSGDWLAMADSFMVLREMAARGSGRAILPCFVATGDPRLNRVGELPDDCRVPIWVACHEDLTGVPRLSAIRQYLLEALGTRQEELLGSAGQSVAAARAD
jgi:DNA-binding transcriptional LysR family regulator